MAEVPPRSPEATGTNDPVAGPAPANPPARKRTRKQRLILTSIVVGAVVLGGAGTATAMSLSSQDEPAALDLAWVKEMDKIPAQLEAAAASIEVPEPEPEPEPQSPAYDVDDPASITVVVNKQRPLNPIDWAPGDLVMPAGIPNTNGQPMRAEAASAMEQMYAAAAAEGMPFTITSAYRPYDMQVGLFDSYAASDGVEAAETYSARAGHSEHQTGLAADLDDGGGCAFMACFGETPTGAWLRDNAHRFGYILRYNQGAEPVVGYIYEPWHFRYVGQEVASAMHESGELNLETHFGLEPAPTY